MITLAPCNELMIAVIKVKLASQLQRRWLFGIASVAALLILGQELDRHVSPSATPRAAN
jgi:hypothetical protein